MKAAVLALAFLAVACDVNIDAPIDVDLDPCRFLSYSEPPESESCSEYLAPDLPIPRAEGEPCRASSGEVCGYALVCGCGVCLDIR